MTEHSAVRRYVWSIVALTVVVLGLCLLQFGNTFDRSSSTLFAILAFTLLALLTGVIESTSTTGISGSVAFVAHLAAVVVVGPVGAALVAAISMAVAQSWLQRPPLKIVFNIAQITLSVLIGGALYLLAGGQLRPATLLNRDFVAFGVLVVSYFVVNSTTVSGAVSISQDKPFLEIWRGQLLKAAGYDLVASALGLLVAWMYLRFGVLSIFAVTLPILALRQAYKENVELRRLNEELSARHRELLDYTVKQIEARDPYTSGHSRRVAEYARLLAREAGLSTQEVEDVTTAALLHDVGKVYHEFASILVKEGRLSPEEKKVLQSHPVRSADLIGTLSNLKGYVELAVRHHHENFDGTGYPDGLVGEQIPIGSRIIMIADTLDAMTTDRPYRRALGFESVLDELRNNAGTQFDPQLIEKVLLSSAVRRLAMAASASSVQSPPPAIRRDIAVKSERAVYKLSR